MSNAFEALGLCPELVQAVTERGYEQPTPIQAAAIPLLLTGHDVMGQAQTGTGKTAAFSLPMLQALDIDAPGVQAIILTPTRELAVQVANTVYAYGHLRGVRVLPVYGGESYVRQINRLQRDTHVVVGTPGRTLDLIQRGALKLDKVQYLVLDEADEMLKMGFIDDVEAIMSAASSEERQTALFSATLSSNIRQLAKKYMHSPEEVTITADTRTVAETEQRYYMVEKEYKFAALTRLLEVEPIESVLIFASTKIGAAELADTLIGRGYQAEAIHGDLMQAARETVLRRFRRGDVTILVATDVVARGMDIPHVSHVINYDMPNSPDDFVHRIGRTGRAGRKGIAISLISPRETRYLKLIEQHTRQPMTRVKLPDAAAVYLQRDIRFVEKVNQLLESGNLENERALLIEMQEGGYDPIEVAAAVIQMARSDEARRPVEEIREARDMKKPAPTQKTNGRAIRRGGRARGETEEGMVKLCLNVGRVHGIRPGEIVGAIAGKTGIPGSAIGAIDIESQQTFVDVKIDHATKVMKQMQVFKLRGQEINLVQA